MATSPNLAQGLLSGSGPSHVFANQVGVTTMLPTLCLVAVGARISKAQTEGDA